MCLGSFSNLSNNLCISYYLTVSKWRLSQIVLEKSYRTTSKSKWGLQLCPFINILFIFLKFWFSKSVLLLTLVEGDDSLKKKKLINISRFNLLIFQNQWESRCSCTLLLSYLYKCRYYLFDGSINWMWW